MTDRKPHGYWTKERVIASAKEFNTLEAWKKACGGAPDSALKHGWYIEATAHMNKISGSVAWKWTKDAVLEDAKKYQSKSEWRKSSGAYDMAHRRGWLDEATQHMTPLWQAKWDKASVIADAKKYSSRKDWENGSIGAYAAALRKGWAKEATAHMPLLVEHGRWTKKAVFADAKKYRTRGEWFNNSGSYYVALKNGWIEEASAHMIKTYSFGELIIYTYLLQHNIEFVHQKRFHDLRHIHALPFDFYLPKLNLLVEYNGIQHKRGWQGNKKNALEIKHRDALKKEYASRNNISYLTINSLNEDDIVKSLKSAIEEIANQQGIKIKPVKRQLSANELGALKSLGRLTKKEVLANAKKYKSVTEWKKYECGAYNKALSMGWKDEATLHMLPLIKRSGYWTEEKVIQSAKPFNSQSAWKKARGGAWAKAVRMKWIAEATAHMNPYGDQQRKPNGYWTKEKVLKSAEKFSTRAKWCKAEASAVRIADKNGWIKEAIAHMKNKRSLQD